MPKLGTMYDYPADDIDRCIEKLTKARKTSNKTTLTREGFATAMGMSPKPSAFGTLIGSMSYYGLVDTGSGQIRVTDLGEKVVYLEGDERRSAIATAVGNVLLFADMHKRYGAYPTEEQVKLFLREEAKVELSKANEATSVVGKLLKTNLPYLESQGGGGGDKPEMPERPLTTTGSAVWGLSTDSYGEIRITDELSTDFAIEALKKFKERFQAKKSGDMKLSEVIPNAEAAAKTMFPSVKKGEEPKKSS